MLTKRQIAMHTATLPEKGEQSIATGEPNLTLRLRPSGAEWTFRYVSPTSGKRRKISLGSPSFVTPADVAARAADLRAKIANATDPFDTRGSSGGTWGELAEQYIEVKASGRHGKPWSDMHTASVRVVLLTKHCAHIAHLPIEKVTSGMVNSAVDDHLRVAKEGGKRTYGVVAAFLNWLRAWSHVEHELRLFPMKTKSRTRKRVLDDDELRACRDALSSFAPGERCLAELVIYTGQRLGQICKAELDQFDGDTWNVPKEIVKIDRDLTIWVGGIHIPKRPYPTGADRYHGQCARIKGWMVVEKLLKQSGIEERFTANDFRRTMRRVMAKLRIPPHIIKLAMGQSLRESLSDELAEHYGRASDYAEQIEAAFAAYREYVDALGNEAVSDKIVRLDIVGHSRT